MPETRQPVVLLTGASSGIGLALTRKLWKSDYRVVVTARTTSLSRLYNEPFADTPRFLIRPLDIIRADLMPDWVPFERAVSIGGGLWLMGWGSLILLGLKVRWAAIALGIFLVIVTAAVHLPGVFSTPGDIEPRYAWMWDILQRSNLAKNMCLLEVCFHLLHHRVGKYSLEKYARAEFRKVEQDCPRVQFLDEE